MSEGKKSYYLASEIENFFYSFFTTPAVHVQHNRDLLIQSCPLPVSAHHASTVIALSNFKLGSFVASFLGKTSRSGAKSFREPYQHLMFAATSYSGSRSAQSLALELDREKFTIFAHAAATTPLRSLTGREYLRKLLSRAIPPPGLASAAPAPIGVPGFADIQSGLIQDEIQLDKATDGLVGAKFKAQVLEIYSEAVERAYEAKEAGAEEGEAEEAKDAAAQGATVARVAIDARVPSRRRKGSSITKTAEVARSVLREQATIALAESSREWILPPTSPLCRKRPNSSCSQSSSSTSSAAIQNETGKQQKTVPGDKAA